MLFKKKKEKKTLFQNAFKCMIEGKKAHAQKYKSSYSCVVLLPCVKLTRQSSAEMASDGCKRRGCMEPVDGTLNSDSYSFTATFKLLSSRFSLKNTIHIKMAKFWVWSLRMLSDPLCLHLPKLVGEQSVGQVSGAIAP